MANYRRVLATVLQPDGTPFPSGLNKVSIKLLTGSYSSDIIFPVDELTVTLNPTTGQIRGITGSDEEELGISLWCEDEGLIPTSYEWTLPDKNKFSINLSLGDGTSINVTTIRAAGITPPTPPEAIYTTVLSIIQTIAQDFSVEGFDAIDGETDLSEDSEDPANGQRVLAEFLRRFGATTI